MATEPPPHPESDVHEVDAWLDGLAGRAGQGIDYAEGQMLRAGLMEVEAARTATMVRPAWSEIEAQAQPQDALFAPGDANLPAALAANDAPFKRHWSAWGALAAGLLMTVGLLYAVLRQPQDDNQPVLRGIGPAQPAQAVDTWYVSDPVPSAEALATALRGLGASVTVTPAPVGVDMLIAIPAQSTDGVAGLLASIKVGIGRDGRVQLAVRPAP